MICCKVCCTVARRLLRYPVRLIATAREAKWSQSNLQRIAARTEVENAPQPGTPHRKQSPSTTALPAAAEEPDVDVAAEYEALPPVTPSKPHTHSPTHATPASSEDAAKVLAPAETPYYTPQGKTTPSSGATTRVPPSEPKPQRLGGAPMLQPVAAQAAPNEGETDLCRTATHRLLH